MTTLINLPTILALLVVIGFAIWKIAKWSSGLENRITKVEDRMTGVEGRLTNVEGRLTRLEEAVARLSERVDRLAEKVDKMFVFLVKEHGHEIAQTQSPIGLSDYGRKLSIKTNAAAVVMQYAERMRDETQTMNSYQVQEHCFAFCDDAMLRELEADNKARFDELSEIAFMESIPLQKVSRVIGIMLRDRVLAMQGRPNPKAVASASDAADSQDDLTALDDTRQPQEALA